MSTSSPETTPLHLIQASTPDSIGEGSILHSTFFEVRVTFPLIAGAAVEELSQEELLQATTQAGTFALLDSPEEDGYNDLR